MATSTIDQPKAAPSEFKPFVSPRESIAELTPRALILGALFGIVFGASTVYLGLKVGLTVSASIPIAVLSITILKAFGKGTILENNIVQTTGSAGESIAGGIVFTIPALLILGLDLDVFRTTLIALTGGFLGVLMMIPLRRALIVKEHGNLPYPEGTACAEVLEVGERGGTDAKTVFMGFGVGFVYKFLMTGLKMWKEIPNKILTVYQGAEIKTEISPELLGVGYIIGPRIASYMFGGGIISALVLVPMVKFFGVGWQSPLFPTDVIGNMTAGGIFDHYVRYIAAGAVATGGIVSLLRSLPTIISAFKGGVKDFRGAKGGSSNTGLRTERDIPMPYMIAGVIAVAVFIVLMPKLQVDVISVLLILAFAFFFTTVSSRITGQIGSSSNPISGMTIATLLFTSLIFLALGRSGAGERVVALTVGAIVCVAAANAGGTSQDLKTGFLVGATPRAQQIGLLVGVFASALFVGWTLLFLNDSYQNILPQVYTSFHAPANEIQGPWSGTPTEDGKHYRTWSPSVEVDAGDGKTKIRAGKYLVDDQGTIHYKVNPGVGGDEQKVTTQGIDKVPPITNANANKTGQMRGLDDQMYDVMVTKDGNHQYFVDATGKAHYELTNTFKLQAPKAALMGILVDGVLTRKLPWTLIIIGMFISILLEVIGIQSLPVAVGMYLPISTSATIFVGGLIRALVEKITSKGRKLTDAEAETGRGVLLGSGLIAGGAIGGLLVSVTRGVILEKIFNQPGKGEELLGYFSRYSFSDNNIIALVIFALLVVFLFYVAKSPPKNT
ncbi:MAG TPA: oligopeptide transporter, OPT family [Blastocatellia bacterium]|nr:oligopeptide transporter, OPT family [Blastocatellia bacterium]